jgi:transcriptional regulator with XRE-family HTH domain
MAGDMRVAELDATTFGEWLRGHRQGLGLTQAELARKVGCATITIQKIEANQRRPSADMARWLAEACEISAPQRQRFLRLARTGRTVTARERVALERRPTNLPLAPPRLIGRERDLTVARRCIRRDGARLLTITGPPGVGKTTLALHLAADVLSEFEDGAFFVPLAGARNAAAVAAAIARTLDVTETGADAPRRLAEYLSGKQLLLVLDNFEQALSSVPIVADLLRKCPWLSVIATSRAPLRIRQERRVLLDPLTLPAEAADSSRDGIAQSPAVALFVERAQAARPDFALTSENADTVGPRLRTPGRAASRDRARRRPRVPPHARGPPRAARRCHAARQRRPRRRARSPSDDACRDRLELQPSLAVRAAAVCTARRVRRSVRPPDGRSDGHAGNG